MAEEGFPDLGHFYKLGLAFKKSTHLRLNELDLI